jgi:site-specific recombinase XerD
MAHHSRAVTCPLTPRNDFWHPTRHLRAENKSAQTVETYLEAVQQLDAFLAVRGVDLAGARRDDIEAYLAGLLARWKPATAANRYRALRVFYAWLEDEGEISNDPMLKMKPPRVPDQPAPVLTEDLLRRLLATCAGRDFEARRDRALILLLLDTGGRRSEIGGMRLGDVNFEYDVVIVVGKGGRERALPFVTGPARRSTSTSGPGPATPMPTWSGSGLAARAG